LYIKCGNMKTIGRRLDGLSGRKESHIDNELKDTYHVNIEAKHMEVYGRWQADRHGQSGMEG
jgi:hypothetical protein